MFIQCLPCHIAYRVVARVESLASDSQYILQTIGLNTQLPVSHQTGASHTRSLTAQYYSQIGNSNVYQNIYNHFFILEEKLLEKLYNIYKFDFILFNFDPKKL